MEQSSPESILYREAWLHRAATFLMNHMVEHGLPRVSVRVSCGWPVRGGISLRRTVIGQCFPPTVCKDGTAQIFISPLLSDSVIVLGTLLHELTHASIGCRYGHHKEFSQAARKVGLAGPPTATVVSEGLRPLLVSYVERVGAYPHAGMHLTAKEKVGSRMRLYECGCTPPVKVRVASDTFAALCMNCCNRFELVRSERG